ncbi:MAG: ribokinase [Gammaproteobacteria bacterium]
MAAKPVTILGIYACDLTFLAARLPRIGETLIGSDFRLGPGGKGSNQAIAARRAGAAVNLLVKLGRDAFAAEARRMYAADGVNTEYLLETPDYPTGTAFIFVDDHSGANAIIVVPGAAGQVGVAEVEAAEAAIAASAVFMTQLETPLAVGRAGLTIARRHGVTTILNPAPAQALPDEVYPLVDYFTPNEAEAAALAGLAVESIEQAKTAADVFLGKGVGTAVITLGANGVVVKSAAVCQHIPAFPVGKVVDTTGAGDAFNGGFAAALAEGRDALAAARFGCAAAGLSVTRPGTAQAMPRRAEIEELLARKI